MYATHVDARFTLSNKAPRAQTNQQMHLSVHTTTHALMRARTHTHTHTRAAPTLPMSTTMRPLAKGSSAPT